MRELRYELEKLGGLRRKHICPGCGRSHKFTLYIDLKTNLPVHQTVGRCDRESSCGYHVTPTQYFQNNPIYRPDPTSCSINSRQEPKPTSFMTTDTMVGSLRHYDRNNFAYFLHEIFGAEQADTLINLYKIGTSKYWEKATVFWQIDINGRVRAGKIIQFNIVSNSQTFTGFDCKRNKDNFPPVHWVHSALKLTDFNMKQCLFGEHLLTDKSKPVAIVESEKTAVIASAYFPQFIWLATGGLSHFSLEKMEVLDGRKVFFFPDLKGFEKWSIKVKELSSRMPLTFSKISDLLEKNADPKEREEDLDLADYLIRFDSKRFRNKPLVENIEEGLVKALKEEGVNWFNCNSYDLI